MNELHTVVIHYLDPEGNEWTNRVITDNPEFRRGVCERAYKAVGYQIVSMTSLDELPNEIQDLRAPRIRQPTYKWMIMATFALMVCSILYDMTWRQQVSRGQVEAASYSSP